MSEMYDHQQQAVELTDTDRTSTRVSEGLESLSGGISPDPISLGRRTDTGRVETGGRDASTPRILVVDDHAPLLQATRGILEGEGYTVFTATNGAQALQVMEEIPPNLIVADTMMPRMDGYDLCRAVRARAEWVSMPFIFLTARAERRQIERKGDGG